MYVSQTQKAGKLYIEPVRLTGKLTLTLGLAFAEKLPYDRIEGFRTAKTSLSFKVLGQLKEGDSNMARPTGVEPVTS